MSEKPAFFDKPERVKGVVILLFITCAGLLLADHWVPKDHVHFPWEGGFGFYAAYGFVACVILVLIAKYILRPLVMRKEDYYD
jgi:hypothetical protein